MNYTLDSSAPNAGAPTAGADSANSLASLFAMLKARGLFGAQGGVAQAAGPLESSVQQEPGSLLGMGSGSAAAGPLSKELPGDPNADPNVMNMMKGSLGFVGQPMDPTTERSGFGGMVGAGSALGRNFGGQPAAQRKSARSAILNRLTQ